MVSYAELCNKGVTYGKVSAKASEVEAAWRLLSTAKRWETLHWSMVARAYNLRAANLRHRRRVGLPLHPCQNRNRPSKAA